MRRDVVLLNLPLTYPLALTPEARYEAVRGFWRLKPRPGVDIALGVFGGEVVEVFRIRRWVPAGTLAYRTRDASPYRGSGRWEFVGEEATDLRAEYLHRPAGTGQNPVHYARM